MFFVARIGRMTYKLVYLVRSEEFVGQTSLAHLGQMYHLEGRISWYTLETGYGERQ